MRHAQLYSDSALSESSPEFSFPWFRLGVMLVVLRFVCNHQSQRVMFFQFWLLGIFKDFLSAMALEVSRVLDTICGPYKN